MRLIRGAAAAAVCLLPLAPLTAIADDGAPITSAAPASTPYAEGFAAFCGAGTSAPCTLTFSAIPARTQRLLTRASCRIVIQKNTGLLMLLVDLVKNGKVDKTHGAFIVPTLIGADSQSFVYQANQAVDITGAAGFAPTFALNWLGSTTSITDFRCFLSGTDTKVP
jgi:hypothetical protein